MSDRIFTSEGLTPDIGKAMLEQIKDICHDPNLRQIAIDTLNKIKANKMSDKIKLDDMTLGQIKELKEDLKKRIGIAISNVLLDFYEKFNVGEVGINVGTIVNPPMECENGDIIVPQRYTYSMGIHFSKEEDNETPQD